MCEPRAGAGTTTEPLGALAVPSTVAPSRKVRVPVAGVETPGAATDAETVTGWPLTVVPGVVTVTTVAGVPTTCV